MASSEPGAPAAKRRLRRWLSILIAIAFMVAAVIVIRNEFRQTNLADVAAAFGSIAPSSIAAAVVLLGVSYACLIGCEIVALSILRRRDIAWPRVVRATFASYALGNAVGFTYATVPAARARLYKDDLSAAEIAGLSAITGAAVMLAGAAAAGMGLIVAGDEVAAHTFGAPWMWRAAGFALLAPALAWVAVATRIRTTKWISRFNLRAPRLGVAAAQMAMGVTDWAAAAAVLYVLMPGHGDWSYPAFLAVFLAAGVLGAVSGAPAGIGVFEASILALSPDTVHAPAMAAALIVYRLIWTVAPLVLGAGLLVHDVAATSSRPEAQ